MSDRANGGNGEVSSFSNSGIFGSDIISIILLVSIGIHGLFILLVTSYFGDNVELARYFWTFLLTTLGVIALALGFERVFIFKSWLRHIKDIDESLDATSDEFLEKTSWTWFIPGDREAYKAAQLLLGKAEHHIRAFSLDGSPRARRSFENEVIRVLRRNRNRGVKFTSAYSANVPETLVSIDMIPVRGDKERRAKIFWRQVLERLVLHAHCGIASQTSLLFLNEIYPIGFDLLLIDEKHAVMGISLGAQEGAYPIGRRRFWHRRGGFYSAIIILRNQSDAVKALVEWYDNMMDEAVSFEELRSRRVLVVSNFYAFIVKLKTVCGYHLSRIIQIPKKRLARYVFGPILVAAFFVEGLIALMFEIRSDLIIALTTSAGNLKFTRIEFYQIFIISLMTILVLTIAVERMFFVPVVGNILLDIKLKLKRYRGDMSLHLSDFRFVTGHGDTVCKILSSASKLSKSILLLSPARMLDLSNSELSSFQSIIERISSTEGVYSKCIFAFLDHLIPEANKGEILDTVSFRQLRQAKISFFDVLIIDDTDVIFGIRTSGSRRFLGAICFENQKYLCMYLKEWFEFRLRRASTEVSPIKLGQCAFPNLVSGIFEHMYPVEPEKVGGLPPGPQLFSEGDISQIRNK